MKLLIIILLFIVFVFSGCIDEPVQQNNVTGILYSDWANRYYYISAGDFSIARADSYTGYFELNVQAVPFKIVVQEKWEELTENAFIFDNVFVNSLHLVCMDGVEFTRYYDKSNVEVNFPPLSGSKLLFTKFISDNFFIQDEADSIKQAGSNKCNTRVYLPHEKSTISGKMYYLEAAFDSASNKILSYDKFGIKDLTISKYGKNAITFTNAEINYNPDEYEIEISHNFPYYFHLYGAHIFLCLPGYNKSSELKLNYRLVPYLPIRDCKIKVQLDYNNYLEPYGSEWVYVNPGENAFINYTPTVSLISPDDLAENITDTSMFIIIDSEGPGLYEFNIQYNNVVLRFYTCKKEIVFGEFKSKAYSFLPNTTYYWQVRKFPNYNNIDEFLSQPYPLDDRYDYIELSKARSFTTAP